MNKQPSVYTAIRVFDFCFFKITFYVSFQSDIADFGN